MWLTWIATGSFLVANNILVSCLLLSIVTLTGVLSICIYPCFPSPGHLRLLDDPGLFHFWVGLPV